MQWQLSLVVIVDDIAYCHQDPFRQEHQDFDASKFVPWTIRSEAYRTDGMANIFFLGLEVTSTNVIWIHFTSTNVVPK